MVLAYQSVKVGRTKMSFGFQTCLKDLFCWFVYYHVIKNQSAKAAFRQLRLVFLLCIICIIVLLDRKVKGRPAESLGRTTGKKRENHRKVKGIGILSAPNFSPFAWLLLHAVISRISCSSLKKNMVKVILLGSVS